MQNNEKGKGNYRRSIHTEERSEIHSNGNMDNMGNMMSPSRDHKTYQGKHTEYRVEFQWRRDIKRTGGINFIEITVGSIDE